MARLNALMKMDGNKIVWNQYDCAKCLKAGIDHQVINVPGPPTTRYSHWGAGLPTTLRQCTACHATDGPWVSTALVGDY